MVEGVSEYERRMDENISVWPWNDKPIALLSLSLVEFYCNGVGLFLYLYCNHSEIRWYLAFTLSIAIRNHPGLQAIRY
jgi:hypothetical protein